MMVGVDIRDGEVLAVAVDKGGAITSRAAIETKNTDVVAAATSAVERVTPASSGPSSLGIAASALDTSIASSVLDSLASRYAALFPQRAVLGPGTAALVAERVGAARRRASSTSASPITPRRASSAGDGGARRPGREPLVELARAQPRRARGLSQSRVPRGRSRPPASSAA
jgi:hypothetical protein